MKDVGEYGAKILVEIWFGRNGILFAKLFWPSVRKYFSFDREKNLKFKAENLQKFWNH